MSETVPTPIPTSSAGQQDCHRAAPAPRPRGVVQSWWSAYREVLLSPEALATALGLVLLLTGWGLLAFQNRAGRWGFLASALVAGFPILRGCLESLWERRISVEVLVGLALVAAVSVGEFQAGAVVAVMLLGGGVLEQATIARARRSVSSLLRHMPEKALVRRLGREIEVPLEQVQLRDRVVVRPGERLAVDGVVAVGQSFVDESPVTGESMPLEKSVGDTVFAGSINQSGMLELEARRVGSDTTLARIQRLVEEAQASQAPVQRIADRAARWYVPIALALAAVVWTLTGQITRGITVLIVFCPCALVLATPTAIVASIGHAARRSILVKGGEFAETVGRVQVVGLDKTGTLTLGRPVVTDLLQFGAVPKGELLRLAASAERFSEHPLSGAVRQAAAEQHLILAEPVEFHSLTGCGVQAQVEGNLIRVGRLPWIEQKSGPVAREVQDSSEQLQAKGHTVLAVCSNQKLLGLMAVRDVVRPEAVAALRRLKEQNIHVVMLTGDNPRAAAVIAAEVGIEETHAGLLPEDKLRLVRQWQAQGKRVAFVGDGINDAPAIAAADIGIAMGAAGTDVALETADIAFLKDDLTRMPDIVCLSRRTISTIRQNIAFSVGLNLVSVLAAGLGWISPIGGAVLHEGGALVVILNAVRLLR